MRNFAVLLAIVGLIDYSVGILISAESATQTGVTMISIAFIAWLSTWRKG